MDIVTVYTKICIVSFSLLLHKLIYSHHNTWLTVAAGPYVLIHHRALTSLVIRFVTIMLLSLPDAMPNKSGVSQPKWTCVHAKHVLSAIFTVPLSLLLFVLLPISLLESLISIIYGDHEVQKAKTILKTQQRKIKWHFRKCLHYQS